MFPYSFHDVVGSFKKGYPPSVLDSFNRTADSLVLEGKYSHAPYNLFNLIKHCYNLNLYLHPPGIKE
jgi:hypothetical protein